MADIKFSEFPKANQSKDSDEIAILQDGVNKMIPSPVLESKIINKTVSRVIEQGGASLNVINLKGVVPTYADLALITPTPELNDAYQVEADGLVYVYTENGFQSDGEGFAVQTEPNGVVEEGNTQAVSGGEVYSKMIRRESIGINRYPAGTNLLQELAESDLNDYEVWESGYITESGNIASSTLYKTSKKYIFVFEGFYPNSSLFFSGNARLACYSSEKELIATIANPTQGYIFDITLPQGTKYVKYSHLIAQNHSLISLKLTEDKDVATPNVFATPDFTIEKSKEVSEQLMSNFGFEPIPIGTNFLQELAESDLNDDEIWADGFITAIGNVMQGTDWYHTVKRYKVYPGVYRLVAFFRLTARVLIYDEGMNIIMDIANPSGTNFNADITIPENGRYIALSYSGLQENVSKIALRNTSTIYPKITPESKISESNTDTPVNGLAVGSFMRDIFKNTHIPKSKKAIATFISDDGNIANDEWYIPLLESKGVFSTFAIITEFMHNNPVTMKPARVKELYELGHDIAAHTHEHLPLATLTLDEVEYQLSRCKTELLAMDINADVFVAPFSSRTDDVSRLIRKYYKTDWKAATPEMILDGTCCNTPPIESFLLKRIAFDAQANGVSTLADAKAAVDVAFAKNEWVAFAIHPQYAEYSPTGNPDGYLDRRQDVSDLIDYILSKNIQILTVAQALEIWRNPVEIGNVRLDRKYYALGMDGTEDGNYFD